MPHTHRGRRLHRPGSAAFGLIGLLIVVAIILYLMFGTGGGGQSYMQGVQKSRQSGKELGQRINTRSLVIQRTGSTPHYSRFYLPCISKFRNFLNRLLAIFFTG